MTTTNKVKTNTSTAGKKHLGQTDTLVLSIGGGLVLLMGGLAIWYIRKKKKEKQAKKEIAAASARTAPKGFRCTGNEYPLKYGTCHSDVGILQKYLKGFGMDLGKSGPNRDGVDGQFGALTRAATLKKLKKDTVTKTDMEAIKRTLKFVGK